jgi:hypothetical protein
MPTPTTKIAFWLVGIVAALLIVWYLWLSKGTPPGQPPLTLLTPNNRDQFMHDFDGVGDEARLVSPTWKCLGVGGWEPTAGSRRRCPNWRAEFLGQRTALSIGVTPTNRHSLRTAGK